MQDCISDAKNQQFALRILHLEQCGTADSNFQLDKW